MTECKRKTEKHHTETVNFTKPISPKINLSSLNIFLKYKNASIDVLIPGFPKIIFENFSLIHLLFLQNLWVAVTNFS